MVISFFRHIDSHHKLIRWRLVIHRCIDGYSRLIIYLHSCNNNKAKTAKAQFLRSVSTFFWPRRSDHGMENIEVVREVLKKFGTSSKPSLTGFSVHNQRIERLWKNVLHYVLHHYIDLFYFMEADEVLDPLNEVHLLALHLVFIERIYTALLDFIVYWNNRKVRTEHLQTSNQLWITGIHQNIEHETVQQIIDASSTNMSLHGVEMNPNIGFIGETSNSIIIPRTPFELTNDEWLTMNSMDLTSNNDNFGINIYLNLCAHLERLQSAGKHLQG